MLVHLEYFTGVGIGQQLNRISMRKEIFWVLVKRVWTSFLILFLLITFLFVLLRISPGDPSQKYISPELSPKLTGLVKHSFGLDGSLITQYKMFIINMSKGEFGISYTYRIPVVEVIERTLPFTVVFSLLSFIIQITLGFILAIIAVKNIGGLADRIISRSSLALYAVPSFAAGVFLIFIFSGKLNLLPSSGLSSFDTGSYSVIQKFFDYTQHLILPLITLSITGIAVFFKYLRDNLEEVYNKPFVEYLRANGISEKEIVRKHIIPNAVSPAISVAGVELGLLFGGALITEVIFSLPGMGRLTVDAILSRDYPLVIGCTFIAGTLVILTNLTADIIKAIMDKRIARGILN
jgi:peptide/nickel transport system permease protein